MPGITIASFNAHGGVRPRPIATPRLWRSRRSPQSRGPFDVAQVLSDFGADLVVVQESFHPDAGTCAAELAGSRLGYEVLEVSFGRAVNEPWPHLTRRRTTTGTAGLAVLTRFPVLARRELPLGRVPGDPSRNRRALQVTVNVEGSPLEVVAVHLSSRLPYGPPYQLRRLAAQLPPRDRRAVIVGDLNVWGPGATSLLPGWRRTVRGRTWPAHRPHSQIDHVLVRDRDMRVVRAAVLDDVGSDHRPVVVTLRWS